MKDNIKNRYKIGMISLGCPKNLIDTEVLLGLLKEQGHTITNKPNESEIIIINTCSFIESAKKESIENILEMATMKENGNCSFLIVTGCLAQEYGERLLKIIPEIDFVYGTHEYIKIVNLIDNLNELAIDTNGKRVFINRTNFLYDHTYPRFRTTLPHLSYIKIAEGCNHCCSFCLIPRLRGHYHSREMDSIIKEANLLIADGVKEITLVAQDSTSYGQDKKGEVNINLLLERIASIKDTMWIRLLYTYPFSLNSGIIELMSQYNNIIPYLDIPLQHSHKKILKSMNRPSNIREIKELINFARSTIPDMIIRTTFMVGFPGESDKEFESLLEFINQVKFDRLGVFTYSREKKTISSNLPEQVSKRVKTLRYRSVMELQSKISLKKNQALIGRTFNAICDYPSLESPDIMVGRIKGQAYDIDGVTYININSKKGGLAPGDICLVKITDSGCYDLKAECI